MDRRWRAAVLALGALLAAWAAYRNRPVRPPERRGEWEPAEP